MRFSNHHNNATKSFPITKAAVCVALLAALAPLSLLFSTSANATALSNPLVGTSLSGFAVLAGSGVTNSGNTVITGDLASAPTPSAVGFTFNGSGPGIVNGAEDLANSVATTAQTDWTTAYNNAVAETPTSITSATGLGNGQTLTAGVYSSNVGIGITGSLTLDGGVPGGVSNSIFVFYTSAGTGLTANTSSTVNLINGAQACNVFWAVGALGATLDGPLFSGTVLSSSAITVDNDETINGRLLASTANVTLLDDTVTAPTCLTPSAGTTSVTPSPTPACTLTSSAISSNVGQAVTFTAAIAGANPTGTVAFADGSVSLGTTTLEGGQASLTTSSLAAGNHLIWANYGGDDDNAACSFGYLAVAVSPSVAVASPTTLPTTTPTATSAPTTISTPPTAPASKSNRATKPVTVSPVSTPPTTAVPPAPTSPIVPGVIPVTG
jgi:hypothetical protein